MKYEKCAACFSHLYNFEKDCIPNGCAWSREFTCYSAKKAVPGGIACQSSEHVMPETTPKGEQAD